MGEIREAIIEDASSIAEISRSSLGYQCDSSLVARRLREMDSDKQKVYVAVENNVVIGFVHVELYQLLYQNDLANVLGLAVRKDMQKKDKKPCVNYAKIGREMHLSLDSKQQ